MLLYYAELADEEGYAYPSQGAIAEELNLGHRDVQHSQTCLQEQGYLSKIRAHVKGHRGTTYQITLPAEVEAEQPAELLPAQAPKDVAQNDGAYSGHFDGVHDGVNGGHVPSTTEKQNYRTTEVILAHSEISERREDRPMITSALVSAAKRFRSLPCTTPGSDWQTLYAGVEREVLLNAPPGSTWDLIESLAFDVFLARAKG